MPSSVTILCQIKSKGQDGGFINGFYKKQISLVLYDFNVADYVLLCGKCVFNHGIMYVSIKYYILLYFIYNYIINK